MAPWTRGPRQHPVARGWGGEGGWTGVPTSALQPGGGSGRVEMGSPAAPCTACFGCRYSEPCTGVGRRSELCALLEKRAGLLLEPSSRGPRQVLGWGEEEPSPCSCGETSTQTDRGGPSAALGWTAPDPCSGYGVHHSGHGHDRCTGPVCCGEAALTALPLNPQVTRIPQKRTLGAPPLPSPLLSGPSSPALTLCSQDPAPLPSPLLSGSHSPALTLRPAAPHLCNSWADTTPAPWPAGPTHALVLGPLTGLVLAGLTSRAAWGEQNGLCPPHGNESHMLFTEYTKYT